MKYFISFIAGFTAAVVLMFCLVCFFYPGLIIPGKWEVPDGFDCPNARNFFSEDLKINIVCSIPVQNNLKKKAEIIVYQRSAESDKSVKGSNEALFYMLTITEEGTEIMDKSTRQIFIPIKTISSLLVPKKYALDDISIINKNALLNYSENDNEVIFHLGKNIFKYKFYKAF